MGNAATEAPASYLMATQFYDQVRAMIDEMEHEHDYLAIELIKYAERVIGNVGAAEAPFAVERRQLHYRMAFAAICGCASACDVVRQLDLAPAEMADAATHSLACLAAFVRPIAEEGLPERDEVERSFLDDLLGDLDGEPWKGKGEDDDDAGGW